MLSDRDILKAISGNKISIEPFDYGALTPNGYDMRVGEIMIPSLEIKVTKGTVKIPKLTRFLVGTQEYVKLNEEYVAELWLKSKWARRGVIASFGLVDAGFEGILTLGAFATSEIELSVGDKFVQICFFKLGTPAEKPYAVRSGNYQGQKNIKI